MGKKRVFISYCHEDVTVEWIEKMVVELGICGIDSLVDIYDLQLGQDLNYFMEQIKNVDAVLILLGKTYKKKANSREGGVGIETQIISNDVYNDLEQTKFIPIVISKAEDGKAYLPYYLEDRLYIDFTDDDLFVSNMESVVRQINCFPRREKPPVINIDKPVDVVEVYLDCLWDLEVRLSMTGGINDSEQREELLNLLDETDYYLQNITMSKEISKERKQRFKERIEYIKVFIQRRLDKI